MTFYAEIAVNISGVEGLFDYLIPPELQEKVMPGCLVEIPYNITIAQGIVLRVKADTQFEGAIKAITRLISPNPVIPPLYLDLSKILADDFLQPQAGFLQAMLPPGYSRKPYDLYTLNVPDEADLTQLDALQQRLLAVLISNGPQRSTQFDRAFSRNNWRKAMQRLMSLGWICSEKILPAPRAAQKKVNTVMLHPDVEKDMIDVLNTGKEGGDPSKRRRKMLRILAAEGAAVRASYLYASTGGNSSDIRFLEKKGLILTGEETVIRDPISDFSPEGTQAPSLTPEQKKAWDVINRELNSAKPKPIMLRGITGSGKTELYLKAAEETVKAGKQALILVPEIALTPQTIQRFLDRFPGGVGVFHSRLSDGERYDTWLRAASGKLSVLIGPRSALLIPLPSPGLIVLDECHDDSYYQLEQNALYDSRDGALALSALSSAGVIFGSATPNVSRYFQAEHENWAMIHLEQRISANAKKAGKGASYVPLPDVRVVDMRAELTDGNTSIFSSALQDGLKRTVSAGQQAVLFLNRRGSATIIFCRDCGHTLNCPHCDFPLTMHAGSNQLLCHTCGYTRKIPAVCPSCGSKRIRHYGMGTEKVEQELQQLIPTVRTLRWDADTAAGRQSEAVILSHFKQHNADVLIGTQMLAKGLDLPLVTLVGMVLADVGLSFPDYRASENAFQLLTQVAGRAGRSELGGEAILQTFLPDHYAIQFAAQHDFHGFYRAELDRRRDIQYPPFTRIICLETRDLYSENAQSRANVLGKELSRRIRQCADKTLEMIGPVPPYFARQRGYYRWQILIKGDRPEVVLNDLPLTNWKIAVNPPRIL
jgi:primosomal protein N' (replication factor Y) (superfamily II helicase)